jgi:hypothetical protein
MTNSGAQSSQAALEATGDPLDEIEALSGEQKPIIEALKALPASPANAVRLIEAWLILAHQSFACSSKSQGSISEQQAVLWTEVVPLYRENCNRLRQLLEGAGRVGTAQA